METWEFIDKVINQNLAAKTAAELLMANGGQVYLIGKALRDTLSEKEPKNLDLLVTGLDIVQIENILDLQHSHLTKNSQGYHFRYSNHTVDIDLPRVGNHINPRIPIEVYLGEADHSVHAMAYDLQTGELIDPYNGLSDAMNGVLRPTNNSSYKDHPENILKGISLHGDGYLPDSSFIESITQHGHNIKDLSPDHMRIELERILRSDDPVRALNLMKDTGLLEYLLPEVANTMGFDQKNKHHDLELGEHLMEALRQMCSLTDDPDLRLAALLHDIGKIDAYWEDESGHGHFYADPITGQGMDHEDVGADMARQFMERLNFSEDRIERVEKLIQMHMYPWWTSEKGARKFYNSLGGDQDLANDWIKLRSADMRGKSNNELDPIDEQNHQLSFQLLQNVMDQSNAAPVNGLEVNGYDLMDLGYQGREIGAIQRALQQAVDNDPSLNNREKLLDMARFWKTSSNNWIMPGPDDFDDLWLDDEGVGCESYAEKVNSFNPELRFTVGWTRPKSGGKWGQHAWNVDPAGNIVDDFYQVIPGWNIGEIEYREGKHPDTGAEPFGGYYNHEF